MDQYTSPTFTLILCRVLPPGISRLSWNCITSYEFFIKCYLPTDSNFSRALSYYTLKDTDNWIEFALRFNKYLNPSLLTNLLILQVIHSLICYIIIELILTVFSDKLKQLSSMDQYTSPTFTLILCRVLPPGISRLSWNCITSYEFFIKCYLPTDSNFSRALSYYTLKDTDNWIEFALRFNKYLNPSLLTNLLILQVIHSLICYIIIELILTVLPGPYSPNHGSNNRPLHHSFDLMSSPIGYLFINSRYKCVVNIINILSSSKISIEFWMRNTILALDELYYHRPLYCLPTNTNLLMFGVIPWVPCYPAIVLLYFGILPSICRGCCENCSTSWEFLT